MRRISCIKIFVIDITAFFPAQIYKPLKTFWGSIKRKSIGRIRTKQRKTKNERRFVFHLVECKNLSYMLLTSQDSICAICNTLFLLISLANVCLGLIRVSWESIGDLESLPTLFNRHSDNEHSDYALILYLML